MPSVAHSLPPGTRLFRGAASAVITTLLLLVACDPAVPAESETEDSSAPIASGTTPPTAASSAMADPLPLETFLALFDPEPAIYMTVAEQIFGNWSVSYAPMLIEAAEFGDHRRAILTRLEAQVGEDFGRNPRRAYRWLWKQDATDYPEYAAFKSQLYSQISEDFAAYFEGAGDNARIRLDEIRWGGVLRDGIPPLLKPEMIPAAEADYLDPDNVVFGVEVNGDARAYPKRILAWHEMFKDNVGGVSVNGVYCTLCGSMIVYETEFKGKHYELGTSGFLYRSNKLMYDHETESLWSTIRGEPVVGPLVGKGIRLEPRSVVTTTWKQWKALHPETQVLSLNTGHQRDYAEGAAYRDYFATDNLMFDVPFEDRRLRNKDEVLALRFASGAPPTAIDVAHLAKTPVYASKLGNTHYVVFTDTSGASRVYAARGVSFVAYDGNAVATDASGNRWKVSEQGIEDSSGVRHERLAAHRAFWFGWQAAHPDTVLLPPGLDPRGV